MDQPAWRSAACRAYAAVVDCLGRDSKLGHAWRAGKAVFPGFALDYAAMALAAVTLAESTGVPGYRSDAERWLTVLLADYATPGGTLAMTERAATDLPLRPQPTNDDAVPNANAVAVEALVRLAAAGGQAQWRDAADRLLAAQTAAVRANPFGHAAALNALDLRLRRADVVIAGADAEVLFAEARAVAYPNRTLVKASNAGSLPDPAMTASPIAAAYVCAEGRCSLPLHSPAELRLRIEEAARGRPR